MQLNWEKKLKAETENLFCFVEGGEVFKKGLRAKNGEVARGEKPKLKKMKKKKKKKHHTLSWFAVYWSISVIKVLEADCLL